MLDLLFSKRASLENPQTSLSDPANWLFEAMGAVPSSAKVNVNEKTALQLTAFWSAVNTISDTVAELPVALIHTQRNGNKRNIKSHPALELIRTSPNPFMTPVVFKSTCQMHSLTWGNGYAMINFGRDGNPRELWPLDTAQTYPLVRGGKLLFRTKLAEGIAELPADDVLHIPALARHGIAGMSIIAEQREAIGHAIAVQQFGAKFFGNGAKPGGLVSFEDKIRDPEKIRKAIEQQYTGENVHGLLVLDNGAKYQSFAIPPDDAQFLQSREFSIDDIGRMFRLPAHFLNKMGQATFNNLEQMGAHFVQFTLMPWLIRWEQELTRKLLTETEIKRGFAFKFNVAGLMRGDIKTRSEVYSSAITNGWMTRNEVRALEEMNPLEGLDDPIMPANMNVVGDEPEEDEVDDTPPAPPPEDDGSDDQAVSGLDVASTLIDSIERNNRDVLVRSAMCERIIAKEINAVKRALKLKSHDEIADKLTAFYRNHETIVAENLALDAEIARQYCAQRCEQLLAGDADIANVMVEITTAGAAELMEISA